MWAFACIKKDTCLLTYFYDFALVLADVFCAYELQGFKYLYLSPDDFKKVSALNSVQTELIDDEGSARYKILTVIGNFKINSLLAIFKAGFK